MKTKVAINGFGRIGRMILRAGLNDKKIKFVAINDLTDTKTLAYLLKHDTAQGTLNEKISVKKDKLIVGKNTLQVFSEKDPSKLPWKKLGVDIVIEAHASDNSGIPVTLAASVTSNEAEDGLVCEKCELVYEIRDDIPVMLIDEAKPLS